MLLDPAVMEGAPLHYRLYRLHPQTGGIVSGSDLAANDDADAIAQGHAASVADGDRIEIWCGTRRVHQHDPRIPPAAG